ncbi:hypothetical protein DEI86_15700 [Curtobacterium sp. MCBD17_028]|nr:hypothetical protein DEI86_15700 [Curtobacterium sp. MCBD17_028]
MAAERTGEANGRDGRTGWADGTDRSNSSCLEPQRPVDNAGTQVRSGGPAPPETASSCVVDTRGHTAGSPRGHAVTRLRGHAVARSRGRAVRQPRPRGHAATRPRGHAATRPRVYAVARPRGQAAARSRLTHR